MIKYFTLAAVIFLSSASVQAQKKSDLVSEIAELKTALDSVKNSLAISRKKEVVSKTEAESYKAQADELLETNKSLMDNINSFTKASIEKSENIGKTLESLQEKEKQLKAINDRFSSHDSVALAVLTDFKRVLGENGNITVASGAVIVALNEATRNGLTSKDAAARAKTDEFIKKIAGVIKMYGDATIVVEAATNTGEFDIALNQATTLVNKFVKQHSINTNRISAVSKDGGFSEGLYVKVMPKFDAFYFTLREQLKTNN